MSSSSSDASGPLASGNSSVNDSNAYAAMSLTSSLALAFALAFALALALAIQFSKRGGIMQKYLKN
jgi:hypothetical protein